MRKKLNKKIIDKIFSFSDKKEKARQDRENSKVIKEDEFERCVICGAITAVPVSMPIEWRENYQVGFGQICTQCEKNYN